MREDDVTMRRRRRGITGTSCGAPPLVLVGELSSSASVVVGRSVLVGGSSESGLVGRSSAFVLVGGSSESGFVGITVSGDSTPDRHNNNIH